MARTHCLPTVSPVPPSRKWGPRPLVMSANICLFNLCLCCCQWHVLSFLNALCPSGTNKRILLEGKLNFSIFFFITVLIRRATFITWSNGETFPTTSPPGRWRKWTSPSLTPTDRPTGTTGVQTFFVATSSIYNTIQKTIQVAQHFGFIQSHPSIIFLAAVKPVSQILRVFPVRERWDSSFRRCRFHW